MNYDFPQLVLLLRRDPDDEAVLERLRVVLWRITCKTAARRYSRLERCDRDDLISFCMLRLFKEVRSLVRYFDVNRPPLPYLLTTVWRHLANAHGDLQRMLRRPPEDYAETVAQRMRDEAPAPEWVLMQRQERAAALWRLRGAINRFRFPDERVAFRSMARRYVRTGELHLRSFRRPDAGQAAVYWMRVALQGRS